MCVCLCEHYSTIYHKDFFLHHLVSFPLLKNGKNNKEPLEPYV